MEEEEDRVIGRVVATGNEGTQYFPPGQHRHHSIGRPHPDNPDYWLFGPEDLFPGKGKCLTYGPYVALPPNRYRVWVDFKFVGAKPVGKWGLFSVYNHSTNRTFAKKLLVGASSCSLLDFEVGDDESELKLEFCVSLISRVHIIHKVTRVIPYPKETSLPVSVSVFPQEVFRVLHVSSEDENYPASNLCGKEIGDPWIGHGQPTITVQYCESVFATGMDFRCSATSVSLKRVWAVVSRGDGEEERERLLVFQSSDAAFWNDSVLDVVPRIEFDTRNPVFARIFHLEFFGGWAAQLKSIRLLGKRMKEFHLDSVSLWPKFVPEGAGIRILTPSSAEASAEVDGYPASNVCQLIGNPWWANEDSPDAEEPTCLRVDFPEALFVWAVRIRHVYCSVAHVYGFRNPGDSDESAILLCSGEMISEDRILWVNSSAYVSEPVPIRSLKIDFGPSSKIVVYSIRLLGHNTKASYKFGPRLVGGSLSKLVSVSPTSATSPNPVIGGHPADNLIGTQPSHSWTPDGIGGSEVTLEFPNPLFLWRTELWLGGATPVKEVFAFPEGGEEEEVLVYECLDRDSGEGLCVVDCFSKLQRSVFTRKIRVTLYPGRVWLRTIQMLGHPTRAVPFFSGPSPNSILTDPSLICHLPFRGDAKDVVGVNSGAVHGAVPSVTRRGSVGGYLFDGKESYIQLSHPFGGLSSGSLTVTAWILVDVESDLGAILGDEDFGIGIATLIKKLRLRSNAGKWHFVAFVRDKELDAISLYVDGKLDQLLEGNVGEDKISVVPFRIGSREGADAFEGRIDDFRVYDVALGATEVRRRFEESNPRMELYPPPIHFASLSSVGAERVVPSRVVGEPSSVDPKHDGNEACRRPGFWRTEKYGDSGKIRLAFDPPLFVWAVILHLSTCEKVLRIVGFRTDSDTDEIEMFRSNSKHGNRGPVFWPNSAVYVSHREHISSIQIEFANLTLTRRAGLYHADILGHRSLSVIPPNAIGFLSSIVCQYPLEVTSSSPYPEQGLPKHVNDYRPGGSWHPTDPSAEAFLTATFAKPVHLWDLRVSMYRNENLRVVVNAKPAPKDDAEEEGEAALTVVDEIVSVKEHGDIVVLDCVSLRGSAVLTKEVEFHFSGMSRCVGVYTVEMRGHPTMAIPMAHIGDRDRGEEGEGFGGEVDFRNEIWFSGDLNKIHVVSAENGTLLRSVSTTEFYRVFGMAQVDAQSVVVSSVSKDQMHIVDVSSGAVSEVRYEGSETTDRVAISDLCWDRDCLYSAGTRLKKAVVQVWDLDHSEATWTRRLRKTMALLPRTNTANSVDVADRVRVVRSFPETVFSCSRQGLVAGFDVEVSEEPIGIGHHESDRSVSGLAVLDEFGLLASCSFDKSIRLWTPRNISKNWLPVHGWNGPDSCSTLCWWSDQKLLASGCGLRLLLWDLRKLAEPVAVFDCLSRIVDLDAVRGNLFSASIGGHFGIIKVTSEGERDYSFEENAILHQNSSFLPMNRIVAMNDSPERSFPIVVEPEIETEEFFRIGTGHESSDVVLFSGSLTLVEPVPDVVDAEPIPDVVGAEPIPSPEDTSPEEIWIGGHDNKIHVVSASTGASIRTIEDDWESLRGFTRLDNRYVAVAAKKGRSRIALFDDFNPQAIRELSTLRIGSGHVSEVMDLVADMDNARLFTLGADRMVKLWQMVPQDDFWKRSLVKNERIPSQFRQFQDDTSNFRLCLSPTLPKKLFASLDFGIYGFDESLQPVGKAFTESRLTRMAFIPDYGLLASGTVSGEVHFWSSRSMSVEADQWTPVHSLDGKECEVVSYWPQQRLLVTGGHALHFWDIRNLSAEVKTVDCRSLMGVPSADDSCLTDVAAREFTFKPSPVSIDSELSFGHVVHVGRWTLPPQDPRLASYDSDRLSVFVNYAHRPTSPLLTRITRENGSEIRLPRFLSQVELVSLPDDPNFEKVEQEILLRLLLGNATDLKTNVSLICPYYFFFQECGMKQYALAICGLIPVFELPQLVELIREVADLIGDDENGWATPLAIAVKNQLKPKIDELPQTPPEEDLKKWGTHVAFHHLIDLMDVKTFDEIYRETMKSLEDACRIDDVSSLEGDPRRPTAILRSRGSEDEIVRAHLGVLQMRFSGFAHLRLRPPDMTFVEGDWVIDLDLPLSAIVRLVNYAYSDQVSYEDEEVSFAGFLAAMQCLAFLRKEDNPPQAFVSSIWQYFMTWEPENIDTLARAVCLCFECLHTLTESDRAFFVGPIPGYLTEEQYALISSRSLGSLLRMWVWLGQYDDCRPMIESRLRDLIARELGRPKNADFAVMLAQESSVLASVADANQIIGLFPESAEVDDEEEEGEVPDSDEETFPLSRFLIAHNPEDQAAVRQLLDLWCSQSVHRDFPSVHRVLSERLSRVAFESTFQVHGSSLYDMFVRCCRALQQFETLDASFEMCRQVFCASSCPHVGSDVLLSEEEERLLMRVVQLLDAMWDSFDDLFRAWLNGDNWVESLIMMDSENPISVSVPPTVLADRLREICSEPTVALRRAVVAAVHSDHVEEMKFRAEEETNLRIQGIFSVLATGFGEDEARRLISNKAVDLVTLASEYYEDEDKTLHKLLIRRAEAVRLAASAGDPVNLTELIFQTAEQRASVRVRESESRLRKEFDKKLADLEKRFLKQMKVD